MRDGKCVADRDSELKLAMPFGLILIALRCPLPIWHIRSRCFMKLDNASTLSIELHCILYVSSAIRLLSEREMEHLLSRARERNTEAGVTGVLLHREGSFMRYIEGPKDGLKRIYRIISQDPLHTGIIELIDEPISIREFPTVSMPFGTKDVRAHAYMDRDASPLPRALRPNQSVNSPAVCVLNGFWNC